MESDVCSTDAWNRGLGKGSQVPGFIQVNHTERVLALTTRPLSFASGYETHYWT